MKPRVKLAESTTPSGQRMALYAHDADYAINLEGQELMHSRANASELLLGELGVARIGSAREAARVLIGGLGLGFTLRSVLENLPPVADVEVAELLPAVIEWNRRFLAPLNGALLDDPRVTLRTEDVGAIIRSAHPESYDAVLLDVDNGPIAMVEKDNGHLYSKLGLRSVRRALKPGGRAAFWSAGPDAGFETRLRKTGFDVTVVPAKVHAGAKRAAYRIFVADLGKD